MMGIANTRQAAPNAATNFGLFKGATHSKTRVLLA